MKVIPQGKSAIYSYNDLNQIANNFNASYKEFSLSIISVIKNTFKKNNAIFIITHCVKSFLLKSTTETSSRFDIKYWYHVFSTNFFFIFNFILSSGQVFILLINENVFDKPPVSTISF